MAHFTRTHPTATWTNGGAEGYITLASDWESLSEKVFKSIDGDGGGTWAPSAPIVIDTSGLLVSGPARVDYGGTLTSSAASRFVLGGGANDWPKLGASHVGRVRTIRTDLIARMSSPRLHWCETLAYRGSIQSIACTVNGASGLEQPKFALPLRVHNGGRLIGATLTFRVNKPRTVVPVQTPKMRLVREDADGNLVPMKSIASGADRDGWVSMPKPATGDAWFANGAAQTFEYTCDQNNVVDDSLYLYWAQVQEEVGAVAVIPAGAGNDGSIVRVRLATIKKVYDVPNPSSFFDVPVGLAAGDAVLCINETFRWNNGIWVVNVGWWSRRGDLAAAVDFSPGVLVPDSSKWEVWECTTPLFGQSISLTILQPDTGGPARTPIEFQRRQPRGNIYHSLACHFDSIADMRPQ